MVVGNRDGPKETEGGQQSRVELSRRMGEVKYSFIYIGLVKGNWCEIEEDEAVSKKTRDGELWEGRREAKSYKQ